MKPAALQTRQPTILLDLDTRSNELIVAKHHAPPVPIPAPAKTPLIIQILRAIRSPFHALAFLKTATFATLGAFLLGAKVQALPYFLYVSIPGATIAQLAFGGVIVVLLVAGDAWALLYDRERRRQTAVAIIADIKDPAVADRAREAAVQSILSS